MKPKCILSHKIDLEPTAGPVGLPSRSLSASSSLGVLGALGALGVLLLLSGCAGELEGDPNRFTNAFGTAGGSTGNGGTVPGGGMSAGGGAPGGGGMTTPGAGGMGASGAPNIPPDEPCFAAVYEGKCRSCHSKDGAAIFQVDLVLEGADLGKRLSTTQATYKGVTRTPEKCVKPALIIDPVTPANSILLKKVAGIQECGDAMPIPTGLTGTDLTCVQTWIGKFGK